MTSEPPKIAAAPWLQRRIPISRTCFHVIASFIAMFILGTIYSIAHSGMEESRRSAELQNARSIGLILFQYAQDHGGHYPHGKSSTEIFQQLLDQKYATDPSMFYIPTDGKSKATSMTLRPENVCWDVTDDVQPHDPDDLFIVFLTGYKTDYHSRGEVGALAFGPGVFVPGYTKGNSSRFAKVGPDGEVPVFNAALVNPARRTYRQLTPTGPLP